MTELESPLPSKEQPKMTKEDVLKKLEAEWDFEALLAPYREGGTKEAPVTRTWGTVIDWLINKHRFPAEVVGAGIFLVWMKIKRDGHFKGDGSHGSAGNDFVHAIRIMCASVMQQKVSQKIFTGMAGKIEEQIKLGFKQDFWQMTPWFVKMWSPKYYKNRLAMRRMKKDGELAKRNEG
jgi:hypothetical protein